MFAHTGFRLQPVVLSLLLLLLVVSLLLLLLLLLLLSCDGRRGIYLWVPMMLVQKKRESLDTVGV